MMEETFVYKIIIFICFKIDYLNLDNSVGATERKNFLTKTAFIVEYKNQLKSVLRYREK